MIPWEDHAADVWEVHMTKEGRLFQSLGGVDRPDTAYKRVVEAELASEEEKQLHSPHREQSRRIRMNTRIQYLARECTHDEYYGQFVTQEVFGILLSTFGRDCIVQSTDPHFNDIPLRIWDSLPGLHSMSDLKDAGDYLTLAGKVCIYKAAARQIRAMGE